ncbi:MAG TPA: hypothetical protein VGH84_00370 [Steroidobacteraceae bacterium]|jgi:hypothetical protein
MSSLPERPNLDHLRKQAKSLLRQYHAQDPAALTAFRQHLPAAKDQNDTELSTMQLGLHDAQSCIARQYGFPSWEQLKQYVAKNSNAAQASTATVTLADIEVARRRYEIAQRGSEQARPRTVAPFDPKNFDKYVGYYQFAHAPNKFLHIFREGGNFFEQLNTEKRAGVAPVRFFPESESKFFAIVVAAQISFVMDARAQVTKLILHQAGFEKPAFKVDEFVAERYEAALDRRIKDNTADPGTEAFLRGYIVGCEKGQPNYEDMSPAMAKGVHGLRPLIEARHQRVGAFKALTFKGVDRAGKDVYEATFIHGLVEYRIPPLNAGGKVESIVPREIPWQPSNSVSRGGDHT